MRPAYAIAAAVPDQGRQAPVGSGNDLANEQHVIAGRMQSVMPALQPGRTALDQGRVRGSESKRHAREAIGVRPRESPRQPDLVVSQDVDGILLNPFEDRQAARAPGKAPDDKRRLQRHGIERICGEPDKTVRCRRTDDGDARRELRQSVAKMSLRDRGLLLAVHVGIVWWRGACDAAAGAPHLRQQRPQVSKQVRG